MNAAVLHEVGIGRRQPDTRSMRRHLSSVMGSVKNQVQKNISDGRFVLLTCEPLEGNHLREIPCEQVGVDPMMFFRQSFEFGERQLKPDVATRLLAANPLK